ncbi:aminoacyl-histidine dipeptidase [Snodgrassella sp. B3882]|uniref:aminoacyl-histidine dipeptidase n=1 Tax=Snodgrassella sp. B3882 TaxID=2818037 RepID=UPI002269F377|nr:aminoacyl-histidine dipeptidase [Snodgrassella sp. B3882]MCX8744718.1 aminoacyl-histidine dipeptidase [Snodgrassella sp. B3882]
MSELKHLEPQSVWQWFERLCAIPRPTFHEQAVRQMLVEAAEQRGLKTVVDAKGNVRMIKPATAGMEDRTPVALQAHMDMVAQKGEKSNHDFLRDPITTRIEDGWVWANDTTLGADNGIGLAMGLAVMFSDDIVHPELTLIVTVEEEVGMGGAEALSSDWLHMPYLINLDTEDAGEIFIGCAGGRDASFTLPLDWQSVDARACRIRVSGLRGGHSGVDIDKNHANANVLLARVLGSLYSSIPFSLSSFHGGELRNVITREAEALIVVDEEIALETVSEIAAAIKAEWPEEEHLQIEAEFIDLTSLQVASVENTQKALDLLLSVPNGVLRMSDAFAGVVETSSNIGVVQTTTDGLHIHCLMRSLKETPKDELSLRLTALARMAGAEIALMADYPSWTPNPDSALLKLTSQVFREHYGKEPPLQIIHAGLECGILSGKAPKLDMVSFGPTIRAAHSPKERLEVATVAECWSILVDLLRVMPQRSHE